MIKKNNKIMVCISPNERQREIMVCELAVRVGLAVVRSDARKIMKHSIYDIDTSLAYFVLCHTFNFRESPLTTQRLYELAARGIAVIVGVKKLPHEYEILSEVFYPEQLKA